MLLSSPSGSSPNQCTQKKEELKVYLRPWTVCWMVQDLVQGQYPAGSSEKAETLVLCLWGPYIFCLDVGIDHYSVPWCTAWGRWGAKSKAGWVITTWWEEQKLLYKVRTSSSVQTPGENIKPLFPFHWTNVSSLSLSVYKELQTNLVLTRRPDFIKISINFTQTQWREIAQMWKWF